MANRESRSEFQASIDLLQMPAIDFAYGLELVEVKPMASWMDAAPKRAQKTTKKKFSFFQRKA